MNTLIIFGSGYLFGAASAAGIAWLISIARATAALADSFGGDESEAESPESAAHAVALPAGHLKEYHPTAQASSK